MPYGGNKFENLQIWRFSLESTDQININNNMQAKQQVPAHSKILPVQIWRVDGL